MKAYMKPHKSFVNKVFKRMTNHFTKAQDLSIWEEVESRFQKIIQAEHTEAFLIETSKEFANNFELLNSFFYKVADSSYESLPLESVMKLYTFAYFCNLNNSPKVLATLNLCALNFPSSAILTSYMWPIAKLIITRLKSLLNCLLEDRLEQFYRLIQGLTIFAAHCETETIANESIYTTLLNTWTLLNEALTSTENNSVFESPCLKEELWIKKDENSFMLAMGEFSQFTIMKYSTKPAAFSMKLVLLKYLHKVMRVFLSCSLPIDCKPVLSLLSAVLSRNSLRINDPQSCSDECESVLNENIASLKVFATVLPTLFDATSSLFDLSEKNLSRVVVGSINSALKVSEVNSSGIEKIFKTFKKLRVLLGESNSVLDNILYEANTISKRLFKFLAEYFCHKQIRVEQLVNLLRNEYLVDIKDQSVNLLIKSIQESMRFEEAEQVLNSFIEEVKKAITNNNKDKFTFALNILDTLMSERVELISVFVDIEGLEALLEIYLSSMFESSLKEFLVKFTTSALNSLCRAKEQKPGSKYLPIILMNFIYKAMSMRVKLSFTLIVIDSLIGFLENCVMKSDHQERIYFSGEFNSLLRLRFSTNDSAALVNFFQYMKSVVSDNTLIKRLIWKEENKDLLNFFMSANCVNEEAIELLLETALEEKYNPNNGKTYLIKNKYFFKLFILLLNKQPIKVIKSYFEISLKVIKGLYENYQCIQNVMIAFNIRAKCLAPC